MKRVFLQPFLIALISCATVQVFSQPIFKKFQSKEALNNHAVTMINEFDLFMRKNGITPPFIPGVKIVTTYSLIYLEGTGENVVLPYWEELYPEQKKIFEEWRGAKAEEFFVSLFNWFFIPHELGHFVMSTKLDLHLTPYENERRANIFATAFLLSNEENKGKIKYLETSLEEVMNILPIIDFKNMSEEEYFNINYYKLSVDPNLYGYFQFKFILNILKNKDNIYINNMQTCLI